MEMTNEERKKINSMSIDALHHESVSQLSLIKQTLAWHKIEAKFIYKNNEFLVNGWAKWNPIENAICICNVGAFLQGEKECLESLS